MEGPDGTNSDGHAPPRPGAGRPGGNRPMPATAPTVGARGELIGGRYRLEQPVARGGMAEVWEAHDTNLDRRVAVKMLHAHLADDPGFVSRFRREALAIARLSHTNVVAVFDTGVDRIPAGRPGGGSPRAYIVMELVRGQSLRARIQRGVSLPEAVAIGAEAADGLAYAHRNGLVHRDVKPANILVSDEGSVKVVDFGIAKLAQGEDRSGEDLTQAGAILGTAKYLSPEQVEGDAVDARSDIYSLGVVLYEMVCGRPPYTGANDLATALQHVRATAAKPRSIRPGIPRSLEDVVLRAMARDPQDRFERADDMARALRAIDLRDDDAEATVLRTSADHTPPAGITTSMRGPVDATVVRSTNMTGRRAPGARRRFGLAGIVVVLAGLALGAGAGVLTADHLHSGANGSSFAVVGLQSYDKFGDGEHDSELPLLVDGNSDTAWSTEQYRSRNFNGNKAGVGVILQLDASHQVKDLAVFTPSRGWSAQVYVADAVGSSLDDWGPQVGAITAANASQLDVTLRGASGRYVLLWITDLGPKVGTFARVVIGELSPRG